MTDDTRKNSKIHDDFESFNIDEADIQATPKVKEDFDNFRMEDEDPDTCTNITLLPETKTEEHQFKDPNDDKMASVSPGVRIREARVLKKMSVLQVADHLYLDVKVIERIEADDYAHLPPPLFIRGYLRSLSKLFNINNKSLQASFEQFDHTKQNSTQSILSLGNTRNRQVKSRDLWPTLGTIGVIITLIVLVVLWQFYPQNNSELSQPIIDVPIANNETSWESSNQHPVAEITVPIVHEAVPTTDNPPPPVLTENVTPTTDNVTPAPINKETVEIIAQPEAVSTTVQDKSIRVLLKNSKVWLRVTDKNGKKLYGGTANPNDILNLEGTPPYKVRVGNSRLDIEYQGVVKNVKEYPKASNGRNTFIIGGEDE